MSDIDTPGFLIRRCELQAQDGFRLVRCATEPLRGARCLRGRMYLDVDWNHGDGPLATETYESGPCGVSYWTNFNPLRARMYFPYLNLGGWPENPGVIGHPRPPDWFGFWGPPPFDFALQPLHNLRPWLCTPRDVLDNRAPSHAACPVSLIDLPGGVCGPQTGTFPTALNFGTAKRTCVEPFYGHLPAWTGQTEPVIFVFARLYVELVQYVVPLDADDDLPPNRPLVDCCAICENGQAPGADAGVLGVPWCRWDEVPDSTGLPLGFTRLVDPSWPDYGFLDLYIALAPQEGDDQIQELTQALWESRLRTCYLHHRQRPWQTGGWSYRGRGTSQWLESQEHPGCGHCDHSPCFSIERTSGTWRVPARELFWTLNPQVPNDSTSRMYYSTAQAWALQIAGWTEVSTDDLGCVTGEFVQEQYRRYCECADVWAYDPDWEAGGLRGPQNGVYASEPQRPGADPWEQSEFLVYEGWG